MKSVYRVALCLAVVLTASVSLASEWESNPFYTSQCWGFGDPSNPAPADSWVFPTQGTQLEPSITFATCPNVAWVPDFPTFEGVVGGTVLPGGSDRTGLWAMFGPTDSSLLLADIFVPNIEMPDWKKEIELVATLLPNVGDPTSDLDVRLYSPCTPNGVWGELVDVIVEADGFVTMKVKWELDCQPEWERIELRAGMTASHFVLLDSVCIETRCVPEPGTIALLIGSGLAALVVFGRRK